MDRLPTGGQNGSWPRARENSLNFPAGRSPLTVANTKFAGQTTSLLPCGSHPSLFTRSFSTWFHPSLGQLPGSRKAQPTYHSAGREAYSNTSHADYHSLKSISQSYLTPWTYARGNRITQKTALQHPGPKTY